VTWNASRPRRIATCLAPGTRRGACSRETRAAETDRPGIALERPTPRAPRPSTQSGGVVEEVTADLKKDPRHEEG
jgi:hypothetical protein